MLFLKKTKPYNQHKLRSQTIPLTLGLSQLFKMRSSGITSLLTVLWYETLLPELHNKPHKNRDEIWSMLHFYYCVLLRNTEMDYFFFKALVLQ